MQISTPGVGSEGRISQLLSHTHPVLSVTLCCLLNGFLNPGAVDQAWGMAGKRVGDDISFRTEHLGSSPLFGQLCSSALAADHCKGELL